MTGTIVMTDRKARKGERTSEDLRDEASRIQQYVEAMNSVADAMDEHELETIEVDGLNLLDRGLDTLQRYVIKLKAAIASTEFS